MEYNNRHDDIPVESIDSSEVLDLVQNVFAQMYNGGFLQLCENGFTDKLADFKNRGFSLNEIKMHLNIYSLPIEVYNGLDVIYNVLNNNPDPFERLCEYCDGEGQTLYDEEVYDEETDSSYYEESFEVCNYCDGSGYVIPSFWREIDGESNKDILDEIDEKFYNAVPDFAYDELCLIIKNIDKYY